MLVVHVADVLEVVFDVLKIRNHGSHELVKHSILYILSAKLLNSEFLDT